MFEIICTLLVAASGVCWSIVYVDSARTGFKQKTYCMPLFALELNICWEGIYACMDLFLRDSVTMMQSAQGVANAVWFCLDIVLLVTFFKFGRDEAPDGPGKKLFVPWAVLALASCLVLQLLFIAEFGDVEGEKYSAYLQNIIMSVCYLYMLADRKSSKGQTMTIAVCKCIGTLAPTIYGTIEGNMFILVTGIVCFVFDVIYIVALRYVRQREAAGELAA